MHIVIVKKGICVRIPNIQINILHLRTFFYAEKLHPSIKFVHYQFVDLVSLRVHYYSSEITSSVLQIMYLILAVCRTMADKKLC